MFMISYDNHFGLRNTSNNLYFRDNKMFDRIALLRTSENSYPPFTRVLSIAYSSYLRCETRRNDEQTKKYVIKYPSFIIKKGRRKKEREW